MTGRTYIDPLRGLSQEDISNTPLEEGGFRKVHHTFTITEFIPKEKFGSVGTLFVLSARDVRDRLLEARYSMSKKEN